MKFQYKALIYVFLTCTGYSQNSSVEFIKYDSIAENNYKLYQTLNIINIFNYAVKEFDYQDTITFEKRNNEMTFCYKGTPLADLISKNLNEPKPLKIDYRFSHGSTFLYAKVKISMTESREILFYHDLSDLQSGYLKLKTYNFEVLSGRYEERKANGEKKVEGQYCQIDSIYTEAVEVLDPETYAPHIEEYQRTRFPFKIGLWKYYDENGKVVKEEDFQFCGN